MPGLVAILFIISIIVRMFMMLPYTTATAKQQNTGR